jgi:hypothetical protein
MTDFVPELTMPMAEADALRSALEPAHVVLEYGSGGSTVLAAQMLGKTVFSVESDANWLAKMQGYFAANPPHATVHLHHGDIGPTRDWGHPADDSQFRKWPDYPNSVWARPDFSHPDLVLIDGRFRVACLLSVMFKITRPVTVLFDDYLDRMSYHAVETMIRPSAMIGRMARFDVTPTAIPNDRLAWIISRFHHAV